MMRAQKLNEKQYIRWPFEPVDHSRGFCVKAMAGKKKSLPFIFLIFPETTTSIHQKIKPENRMIPRIIAHTV
jgi:hypothetical protein